MNEEKLRGYIRGMRDWLKNIAEDRTLPMDVKVHNALWQKIQSIDHYIPPYEKFQCECTHNIQQHMLLEEPDITANELFANRNISSCQLFGCDCGKYHGTIPDAMDVERM